MGANIVKSTLSCAVLLPVVFLALSACGDEDTSPVAPETEVVDVDTYVAELPPWVVFAAPMPDEDLVADEPSLIEQQGDQYCTERPASITRNPEEIVMFSPDAEVMWLGSLIQGRTHRDGLGSLLELPIRQRAPVTLAIDLLFSDNQRSVPLPDVASVGQAIGELIDGAQAAGHRAGSSIFFNKVEHHSFEQASLSLGLSFKRVGGKVRTSFEGEASGTDSTSTIMATFTQKMFTTSIVLPQSPGSFFDETFTPDVLQDQVDRGNIGPDNLPVYVSSITWGRMLLVQMTSEHTARDMKAALSFSAGKQDSLGISGHYGEVLDNAEFTVAAIGGHAQAAIDLIRDGRLSSYFNEDAPLTAARPISYVLRSLSDNSIAKVSETTEYTIRSCEPGGVRHFLYFDEWETAVGNAVGPTLAAASFPTIPSNLVKSPDIDSEPGTNEPLGYQLSFPDSATGLGFDFVLLNRSAANIPENSVQKWGLVFADTELPDHDFPGHGWISIGDVDGVGSGNEYRSQMENDDFVIELLGEASVYAIGFDVGDNDKRSGESITVEGGGFSYTFADPAQIPGEGFVGFLAPFPIERIIFDEDAGGDDIALRDLVFGVEASGN